MSKKLKVGDLVQIDWCDAYASLGWRTLEEALGIKQPECFTVGFYLGRTKKNEVVVAASWDRDNKLYTNISVRPHAMITKIRKLK